MADVIDVVVYEPEARPVRVGDLLAVLSELDPEARLQFQIGHRQMGVISLVPADLLAVGSTSGSDVVEITLVPEDS